MKTILIVTEPVLPDEVFKRRWAGFLYQMHVRIYRWMLHRRIKTLLRDPTRRVVVLTSREFLHTADTPARAQAHYYDIESSRVDFEKISNENDRFLNDWYRTSAGVVDKRWTHRDISLPQLLKVIIGINLHLEVTWYVGVMDLIFSEHVPSEVFLMTGASIPERIASMVAARRKVDVHRLAFNPVSTMIPQLWSWLLHRAERRKKEYLIAHPRQPNTIIARPASVLFVSCRGRHVQTFKPIIAAMQNVLGVSPQLLVSTMADTVMNNEVKALSELGVDCFHTMDTLPRSEAERLSATWASQAPSLWAEIDNTSAAHGLYHEGIDLWSLFEPFLKAVTEEMCNSAILFVEAIAQCLSTTKPKQIIVIGDRRIPERAALLLAPSFGIKTCFYLNNTILSREMTNKYELADEVLVVGENIRKSLQEREDVTSQITVIGDPRFDLISSDRADRRVQLCTKYGLEPTKPIVVVASKYTSTNFTIQEKETLYRMTQNAFDQLPGYQWIVKIHPNEDKSVLRKQLLQWSVRPHVILQNIDIVHLFGIADAALMVTSMAGLEAMILNVPVVAVQPGNKDFDKSNIIPYIGAGVVWRATNATEVVQGLRTLIENSSTRNDQVSKAFAFASCYIRPPDGKSIERMLSGLGIVESVNGSTKQTMEAFKWMQH